MTAVWRRRRFSAALGALWLCGCAVGPDFKPPEAPKVTGYLPAALPPQTGTDAQKYVAAMDIPGQWWTLFHSQALNELIQQALANNPTLKAAQASLRQANENLAAQRGSYYPSAQASYDFSRNRDATGTLAPTLNSGTPVYNLHTAQVSVSYLFDVFGLYRRQVESAQALAEAQRYQLEAAYLTLTSNVVTAAIQEASLRAQIGATLQILDSERESARILRRQFELGSISQADVMAQETAVASLEATVPPLQKQLAAQRHLLSALAGRFPSDEPPQQFELSQLTLPLEVPMSVPATLVRQRPDILAAEAQLHSTSAELGVATANLFPQITLTGNYGGASTVLSQMFAAGNTFWSIGGSLTQTLFQGGTLIHQRRAAVAALDAAGENYRAVVLAAFQNVADTLTALQLDADAVNACVKAEQAAANSLSATRHNVELGLASYLALLSAQQSYSQAVLNLEQARANRYSDTAALLQALGGGWWNKDGATAPRATGGGSHPHEPPKH
jgi:NodT family efflux transporter outer membrane factor (OMF) lipoprotein